MSGTEITSFLYPAGRPEKRRICWASEAVFGEGFRYPPPRRNRTAARPLGAVHLVALPPGPVPPPGGPSRSSTVAPARARAAPPPECPVRRHRAAVEPD